MMDHEEHKNKKTRIVVMGCGGSGGVPYAGNVWGQCDPYNPKNRRTRPSIYIERGDTRIVIDTGPEFRMQVNAAGARAPLAGVLYTHGHSDHVNGMDDLRAVWHQSGKVPVQAYANAGTISEIQERFRHVVLSDDPRYPNTVMLNKVQKDFMINDVTVQSFDTYHYRDGQMLVTGYRIGDFGYTTDATILTEEAFATLKGVKIWVVGMFWREGDQSHPGLQEILEWNRIVGADQIFTTHLTSHLDYDTMCAEMPAHVRPAYDGLEFLL